MRDETEEKILDVALKIFAKEGYVGAPIWKIAEESGFSEKTIFRRFGTKKNLFDTVLTRKTELYHEDVQAKVIVDEAFGNPAEFIEHYVKNLARVNWDHFEYFSLAVNYPNEVIELGWMRC